VQRWLDQAPDAWGGMVRAFVAEYPETTTAIGAALDAGDRARAGDLLHRLRGAGGALGAEELPRQIEALDFPTALETLRGLGEGVFAHRRSQ
jgi:HPt (histidine-containing phosphotransfer) domain-containing protein